MNFFQAPQTFFETCSKSCKIIWMLLLIDYTQPMKQAQCVNRCNKFSSFCSVMRYTDYYDHCDYYDDGNSFHQSIFSYTLFFFILQERLFAITFSLSSFFFVFWFFLFSRNLLTTHTHTYLIPHRHLHSEITNNSSLSLSVHLQWSISFCSVSS